MNKSLFEATWTQVRAHLRAWWPQLAAEEIDAVAGDFDEFIHLIQTTYGYTQPTAEEEFQRRWVTLREGYVAEEFRRRLARIQARQKTYSSTPKQVDDDIQLD